MLSMTAGPRRIRHALRVLLLAVGATSLTTCGLDKLTGSSALASLSLEGASALVLGESQPLLLTADGAPPPAGVTVAWSSDSPGVATVDAAGTVTAVGEGTATITARISAPELPPAGVVRTADVTVRYKGMVATPVDSLTGLGQTAVLQAMGTDIGDVPRAAVAAAWTTSDATILGVTGTTATARKNGIATITATYVGLTAQTTVRVRQVAKSITFAATPFVFRALGRDTNVAITVRDTRDSVIASPAISWATLNAAAVTVTAAGVMRGLQATNATVRASVDTVVQNLSTQVNQTPATVVKVAGDAQTGTVGAALLTNPQVMVVDAGAYPIAGATVTFSIQSGGGSVTGPTTTANASGVATVGGWTLGTAAGAMALRASAGTAQATFTATGTPDVATQLVVLTSLTSGSSGSVLPAIQVAVRDQYGNNVTTAANPVTLTVTGGTATGTITRTPVNGVVTFDDIVIASPGTGIVLGATSPGLTAAPTSQAFPVFGPAAKLAFTVQPTNVAAGSAIAPAIQVAVQDAAGNTLANASSQVTLAIGNNPATGALTGGAATAASSGVATFAAVSIDRAGTGYTLTASAAGLTSVTSGAFNVVAGAANRLAFRVQPSNTAPASVLAPAIQVAITDALGNTVTTAITTVTLAIGTNPSAGTLTGTTSVAAVAGVATFSTLQINNAGNGYTLTASATGLTGTASGTFNILGPGTARALEFVTQPSTAVAGVANSPSITVKVVDSVGTTVNTSTASVTLALGANPNGGTLSGTLSASAVAGVATFSNVRVNRSGGGYTLVATSTGLTPDTSATFAINVGTAAALAFTQQPTAISAGAVITPAVQVSVTDNQGNLVTSATDSITIAIGSNPGTATLGGTRGARAVNGVATFADLTLNKIGNNYTLTGSATGRTAATSGAFNVTAGVPAVLDITTQPSASVNVGATMSTVVVTVRDAGGNTVSTATTPVTVQLLNNPTGAALGGTPTVNAVNGVASFTTLTVDKPGQGYTLVATANTLVSDTSTAFNGIGPATALFYTTQPSTTIRNGTISPSVVVEGRDAAGNRATGATNSVTLAIGTNPSAGTLGGTVTKNLSAGVATFSNLTIDAAGSGYTLQATGTGLTSAISSAFDINAFGSATKLAFVTQPTNADAGAAISPDIQVVVQDAQANTVTSSTASVTLAFGANPGAATLGGTVTVSTVSGVATFSGISVSATGSNYTLTAASSGLTSANSGTFNVATPGSAIRLAFAQPPTNTTAGSTLLPVVQVCAVNSSNAVVTTYGGSISVVVNVGPVGATIAGGGATAAVSGCVSFPALRLTKVGSYQLSGLSTGLTSVASPTFTVSPGPATKLGFLTSPPSTTAGQTWPTIQVAVQDAYGNTVQAASNTITVDGRYIGGVCPPARPAFGACLVGSLSSPAVNGVATFSGLRPRSVNLDFIGATSAGLADGQSSGFAISASSPHALDIFYSVYDPYGTPGAYHSIYANGPFNMRVWVIDSLGNDVPVTNSIVVSIALGANPTGAALSGVTAQLHNSQYLNFNQARVDKLGTGYTIVTSATGLVPDTTLPFQVVLGAPSQLTFTVQPGNTQSGATMSPAIQVEIRDTYGNLIPTATGTITLGLGSNPGSTTLGGTKTITIVGGVATFSDLSIGVVGNGYTLSATTNVSGVVGAFLSAPFDITP